MSFSKTKSQNWRNYEKPDSKIYLWQFDNKNFNGHFDALAMFIDISGFTEMTDKLMKNGKEGAEILINVINKVFTPSINTITQNGGYISTFGGDAFYAIFPPESILSGLNAATEINLIFQNIGLPKTKFGEFHLSVKIRRNEKAEMHKQTAIAIYKELLEKFSDEDFKNKINELKKYNGV
jgi:hypothetical protein